MKFVTVRGSVEPKQTDFESSHGKVYVRRNIHEVEVETFGETVTQWEYEECLMTMNEYTAYSQSQVLDNQRAMDMAIAEVLLNQMEV